MTKEELAANAATIIEERGLAKHELEDEKGRVCVRGAMFLSLIGRSDAFNFTTSRLRLSPAQEAVWRATERDILDVIQGGWYSPAHWNNAHGTTAADVIAVLRKVAGKDREEERELALA